MMWENALQILSGFIGTLCFGILFNIRGKRLVVASVGGIISWSLVLIFSLFLKSDPVNYGVVAALMYFYAHYMAKYMRTPTTTFILMSLVPLIPGGSLYYTMALAFAGETQRFLEKGLYTLSIAAALALGTMISSIAIHVFEKKKK